MIKNGWACMQFVNYYDIPLSAVVADANRELWYVHMIEEAEGEKLTNEFIYAKLRKEEVRRFLLGQLPIRTAMLNSEEISIVSFDAYAGNGHVAEREVKYWQEIGDVILDYTGVFHMKDWFLAKEGFKYCLWHEDEWWVCDIVGHQINPFAKEYIPTLFKGGEELEIGFSEFHGIVLRNVRWQLSLIILED